MTALKLEKLGKEYPAFTLKDVSFCVEEGRICGLVGANGAGKSTTIKGIVGLIPTSGSAEIFGLPANGNEAKQLLGYAGGGFRFYPHKTVEALARATALFYGAWDAKRFNDYCARFGLLKSKKITELSEGMKVKLSLALALSHGARLLILDEPTSGLDPLSREEFCDTVLSLVKEEGVSVLFSTHITSDLTRIADDIVFLSHGEVLAKGSLSALMQRYRLAHFVAVEAGTGAIGLKPVKDGYEGLVKEDFAGKAEFRAPTLDEIIIHLECAARQTEGEV
ncbi:MAG: ABC transporter ATP-binding protein [Clostridia bacterium]|nr:ABC transporter ATP-binding protein [Clostridia bacterium]